MAVPALLANFNMAAADVSVWLFRKSRSPEGRPVFTGHWIDVDEDLSQALLEAVTSARDGVLETQNYSLTATLEIGQALTIESEVTEAPQLVAKAAHELPARKATKLRDVQNTDFYVVKVINGNEVIHAVKRTDSSWTTRTNINIIKAVFSDDQLGLNPHPDFHLSKHIDFIISGDEILVLNKQSFEQVLSYKEAHAADFVALQQEPAFISVFLDIAPLVEFVGTNKLHLRRVCAIRAKGHYSDPVFMQNLRMNFANADLNLTFDPNGKLVATPATCGDIIKALLNHRLYSRFSNQNFDVPNATAV